jgi:hypothetical protein
MAGNHAKPEHAAPGVREFLQRLRRTEPEAYPAIGIGTDLRFDTAQLSGAALAAEDRIVHLCAFQR